MTYRRILIALTSTVVIYALLVAAICGLVTAASLTYFVVRDRDVKEKSHAFFLRTNASSEAEKLFEATALLRAVGGYSN